MKALRFTSLIFCSLFCLAILGSCGAKQEVKDKTGKEYTSAYICPMYCAGSGLDVAGKCPTCKMDYVVNRDAVQPVEHNHGHDHNNDHHHGHDHSNDHHHGHEGHNH